jgi:hypothetical protein
VSGANIFDGTNNDVWKFPSAIPPVVVNSNRKIAGGFCSGSIQLMTMSIASLAGQHKTNFGGGNIAAVVQFPIVG